MKIKPRIIAGVAMIGLVGTLGMACSDDAGSDTNSNGGMAMTPIPSAAAARASSAESAASGLRAGLTALLQEHVYLAGTATGAALSGGDFTNAAKALDANSIDLSKAIGSVYGTPAETAFLELWRKHIGFFVDYTQGKAANDMAKMAKARTDLDGYRSDFGAFLASANPNLPKEAVAAELKPHVDTLFAAIDAQAAKDPNAFMLLRTAASHMPHTADTLAFAIAKQMPDKFASAGDMLTMPAMAHDQH